MKRLAIALTLVVAWGSSLALPATQAAATPQSRTLEVPVVLPDTVNVAGNGFVPVVLVSTDEVDATEVDLDTVVVGGATPAGRWDDGSVMATTSDVTGDGRDDLVVHVDKEALVGAGDLDAATAELAVSAALPGGDTLRGTAPVEPQVTLELKFDEELRVRGTDRTLRSQRGSSLEAVREVLARHDGALAPMVDDRTTLALDRRSVEALRHGGQRLPDMASWYRVTLPAAIDVDAVTAELEALGEVAFAYPAPEPAPPPQVVTDTPDFTGLQDYFGPAPQGIDADFTRQDPRVRGAGIKIVDLEYNWNPFHEDLQLDVEPEGDIWNLAPDANVSCSYTSPWESCGVLNSGNDPSSSNPSSSRWGTWPNGGAHWIQLAWSEAREVAVSDIYWFQDSSDGSNSGVKRPSEWSIQYWDGAAWQDVEGASGYGTALNQYNRTTFDAVTTTQLRANVQTRSDAAGVGALQWKVYTEPPPDDLPEPETWTTDVGDGEFVRINTFGDDHGTAVFGELVALDNDYGVTGGVPDADMYGISPVRQFPSGGTSWQPGPALAYLASRLDDDGSPWLKPGDAVILEQQTSSPLGGSRYAPLEWIPSVFDAIVTLTGMGVNVVSTGGNGNTNSDDPMYTRGGIAWFDPDVQHSGSILVGAGGSGRTSNNARERLNFSNYGTRFDLQAWGQHITTTGYCTLYCVSGNHNIRYSQSFSGTSGAGPIVTAAVVAVQSYVKATGQDPWSAQEIADVLKASGTPQGPNTAHQNIGPLPNLRAALVAIEVDPPVTTAELGPAPTNGWYADPTVTLTADDGWGSGVAVTEYRLNGGDWTAYDGPFEVAEDGEHTLEYRSTDHNGNVEDTNELAFGVDTTAPDITIGVPADGSVFLLDEEATVDFACTDALSGVTECEGSLPPGSALPTGTVGFHQFGVSAGDVAGNTTQADATYQVAWPFDGFLAPLDAPGYVTTAGSTVPVHFGLGGDRGLGILESGYPASTPVDCSSGEALGAEVPAQSAVGLRYTEEARYMYPWRTLASWSGTCRTLTVKLVDGSVHEALLTFQ